MSACTTRENLWKILDLFEELSVTCWLDGGWGVDALYGKQTRDHRDIDINYDADKARDDLGERKKLKLLIDYCSLQNRKGTISHFLILDS